MLGVNDADGNVVSVAKFHSNLRTLIAALRENFTGSPQISLVASYQAHLTYSGSAWSDYVSVMEGLVAADPTLSLISLVEGCGGFVDVPPGDPSTPIACTRPTPAMP